MIEVICSCGEKHRTPEKNAGRSFNCPKCGVALCFPSANQPITPVPLPSTPVAPPPLPKQTDWFYAAGSVQKGPHSLAEMQEFYATGSINRQTSVWHDGMQDWLPAGSTEVAIDGNIEPKALSDSASNPAVQQFALYAGVVIGTVAIDAMIASSVIGLSENLFGDPGYSIGYTVALFISAFLAMVIVGAAINFEGQAQKFCRQIEERIHFEKYQWLIRAIIAILCVLGAIIAAVEVYKSQR